MKSILVVEDNEAIIKGLKYLLEQEQFHVIACKNIEETMNIIGKQDIDLAVLDITLPDGSGYEMCEYIKKYTNTPIIFLTNSETSSSTVLTGTALILSNCTWSLERTSLSASSKSLSLPKDLTIRFLEPFETGSL